MDKYVRHGDLRGASDQVLLKKQTGGPVRKAHVKWPLGYFRTSAGGRRW